MLTPQCLFFQPLFSKHTLVQEPQLGFASERAVSNTIRPSVTHTSASGPLCRSLSIRANGSEGPRRNTSTPPLMLIELLALSASPNQ